MNRRRLVFLILASLVCLCLQDADAVQTTGPDLLAKVHPGHPRLMMTSNTVVAIKSNLAMDPWLNDTIALKQSGDIWWFLQSRAQIKPSADNRTLTLTQDGQTLSLKLLSPASAKFETGPCEPLPASPHPPKQALNTGVTRIAIHLANIRETSISVIFQDSN